MSHATAEGAYVFPASFAQRRLWFIEQIEDSAGAYNVCFALRFRGELDCPRLAEALSYLENRHEVLRTTFAMERGALIQVVRPPMPFPLRLEELVASGEPTDTALTRWLQSEVVAPFDLGTGPLTRAAILRTGRQEHVLVITMHHSIVDAWSVEIMLRELAETYATARAGRKPELAPLPIQYADYSVWQNDKLSGPEIERELNYWRLQLGPPLPVLELPADHPRPPAQTYRGGRVTVDIGPDVAGPIRQLARESNVTMFMALLASYQVFLHRHSGQTDLVIGTPISGRNHPDTAGLIGCFLNTLAIRTDLSGVTGFRELLEQVRTTTLEAYGAQAVPFEMLVDTLHVPRDLSSHPISQAAFVFQPAPAPLPEFPGLAVERFALPHNGTSKFDLLLSIDEMGEGLQAEFEYNSDLFDRSTAERMAERYRVLLSGIASAAPEATSGGLALARLPIMTPTERTLVLETWSRAGDTRAYVLDEDLRPVPIGVRGELWTGEAPGKRGDSHLNGEGFRPDPFSGDPNARIRPTGDLARYRADGLLELLGRTDARIRGFRIEPLEIEGVLRQHPAVADTVVMAQKRGSEDARLVAYIVATGEALAETADLKGFLRTRLPHYAVPAVFVHLPELPLGPDGKLDRTALPEPADAPPPRYRIPNSLETQILLIWEQVLGRTGISLDDNFFDLGGTSLRAIALLFGLEKALGRRVPVSVLYQGQTVAAMAEVLKQNTVDLSFRAIAIQQGRGGLPLFVVPGVGGNVIGYEALARALDPDQPFYGLRSVGLDGEAAPLETVEAIAASHLSELRRVQPHGPYRLLGFCMGGIIAYEMALQLAAGGERLALVGLIDTWAPGVIPSRRQASRYGLQLAFLGRGVARHLRLMWQRPRGLRFRYLLQKSRILSEMIEQHDVYRGERHQLHRDLVVRANQRAAAHYVPRPYEGSLLLILSSGVSLAPDVDPRLSWRSLARQESRVVQVVGEDSGSLLRPPFVEGLAEALRKHLAEAAPSPT